MFSLESLHRGDSNEYKQYTIFNTKKEEKKRNSPLIIVNLLLCDFFQGAQKQLEIAMANEPSVFEPLKFYCMFFCLEYPKRSLNRPSVFNDDLLAFCV